MTAPDDSGRRLLITAETSDTCGRVVCQISRTERIIRCANDIQFIAQRRKKGGAQRSRRALAYFTTPAGASRLCATFRPAAMALFEATEPGAGDRHTSLPNSPATGPRP